MNLNEVKSFIEEKSSFGFEMQVLKKLRGLDFDAQHSGTYQDPSTGLYRQYDIRAQMRVQNMFVFLSVECKRISDSHPLIVSCTKRQESEAFHQVFSGFRGNGRPTARINKSGLYSERELVGRSLEQGTTEKKPKGPDDIWPKFNQATQASISQTVGVCQIVPIGSDREAIIIPCLVVPDGLLWCCTFDDDGDPIGSPSQVDRLPLFLGLASNYQPTPHHPVYQYAFSHLELMTISGIKKFCSGVLNRRTDWSHVFPS